MSGSERFLALGDSFTIGTGIPADRSFPIVLSGLLRASGGEVVLANPAVNGYATDDLIREELPLVARFGPTFVTLLVGANDIVRGSGEDRYRARLALIHRRIRTDAPTALVLGLPQPDWSRAPAGAAFGDPITVARSIERFNEIARDEAAEAGATWVDLFPLMRRQAERGAFAPDGLHPSVDAHAEWARELASRLGAIRASASSP